MELELEGLDNPATVGWSGTFFRKSSRAFLNISRGFLSLNNDLSSFGRQLYKMGALYNTNEDWRPFAHFFWYLDGTITWQCIRIWLKWNTRVWSEFMKALKDVNDLISLKSSLYAMKIQSRQSLPICEMSESLNASCY